jgi:cytochrome b
VSTAPSGLPMNQNHPHSARSADSADTGTAATTDVASAAPATAGDAASPATVHVRVWEWPIRAFHWAIVALLVALVVTAKAGGSWIDWHMRAGYAMLALVLFRVLWGFFGGPYARFFSFVRGPGAVLRYARSMVQGTKEWHVGHNPLGGWSIVLLLLALFTQAATGLFSHDDVANEGPLARFVTEDLSSSITWFHRRHVWWIYALVAVHVTAVFTYLVAFRENLIHAMVTGVKRLPASAVPQAEQSPASGRALVLLALAVFAVWWVVTKL